MNRISQRTVTDWITRIGFGRLLTCVALVGVGLFAGAALQPGAALGEVKSAAVPQSFQTGDQLALPVLKDIAATLHQMDARISRIEAVAQTLRPSKTTPPTK